MHSLEHTHFECKPDNSYSAGAAGELTHARATVGPPGSSFLGSNIWAYS